MGIPVFSCSSVLRHYRYYVEEVTSWSLLNRIDASAEAIPGMPEPAKVDPVRRIPFLIWFVTTFPTHNERSIGVAELRMRLSSMMDDSVPTLVDKVVDRLAQFAHVREYAISRPTTRTHSGYAVYVTYYVNIT